MLDYEKIIQGKMLYAHEDIVNISLIISTKVELFKNIIEQNEIFFTTDIQDHLYTQIDSSALDRVLNNIIDNAVKYNKEGGTIHIRLKEEENLIRLEIRDTGTGIPKDQLPHIFQPYYRSKRPQKNIQGIGAGLSIVKNILNEVNAGISITSTEGKETIVTIEFRKKDVNADDHVDECPALTKPVNRRNISLKPEVFREGKKIIFFVEGNIELVKFLEEELLTDYNFYSSFNGRDAMKKLEIIPKPDLIISDILMDIMDGYDFIKTLKENKKFQDVPLIFLSAKTSIDDQTKGLELGAVDYMTKPFNMEILKAKIDALIRDHDTYTQSELENFETRVLSILRSTKKQHVFLAKKIIQFKISPREKDVLIHLLNGLSNKEIADILFIGIDTVKKHIQHIKEKCGVKRRIQLLAIFKN
jgi:DNA-binding NarL/FixJ family response regulator/anti-sigma regulatory factor (Ser/Thr protein kinase)